MDSTVNLSTTLVSHPPMWRLMLETGQKALQVAAVSTVEDNSLIARTLPIADDAPSLTAGIEEIVYDNPLLLADFKRVDVLIDTPRFMVVPTAVSDMADEIAAEFWREVDDDFTTLVNPVAATDSTVIAAVSTPLLGFINRTFPEARVQHRIVPLCTYFAANNRIGNSDKLYVNLGPRSVDVMAFAGERLLIANTYPIANVDDAVYYVLKAGEAVKLNRLDDRIYISGASDLRDSVIEGLRKYVSYVMPLIFPADAFRHGKTMINLPFELAILPLCE